MYPRQVPHFFPQNEGLKYQDLSLVKHAYENKKFGKIYARCYLAKKDRVGSEQPKILTLDEGEVKNNIQKKLVRCQGEKAELKKHFKKLEGEPINIDFPQNLRVSSDKLSQSVYTYRNAVRKNAAHHLKYNPALDSLSNKKLYKGIYT